MAAGTAAALVPIRSITRRIPSSSPQSLVSTGEKQPRVSAQEGEETITYIPESQGDAGQICLKLLTQLKGIQLGKVKDEFGWCFKVDEQDRKKARTENGLADGNAQTVDQLD